MVLGTEDSGKTEVNNALFGFSTNGTELAQKHAHPEHIFDLHGYSVYSAPSFSKSQPKAQTTVSNYFLTRIFKTAGLGKLLITLKEKDLGGESFKMILDNGLSIISGNPDLTDSVGFVVTGVTLASGEKIESKLPVVAESLFTKLSEAAKSGKFAGEIKKTIDLLVSKKETFVKQVGILIASNQLKDSLLDENRKLIRKLIETQLNFKSYSNVNLLKNGGGSSCAQTMQSTVTSDWGTVVKRFNTHFEKVEVETRDVKGLYEIFDTLNKGVSQMVKSNLTFNAVLDMVQDFLIQRAVVVTASDLYNIRLLGPFLEYSGYESYRNTVRMAISKGVEYTKTSRDFYFFLQEFEKHASKYNVMKDRDTKYKHSAQSLLQSAKSKSAQKSSIRSFLNTMDKGTKQELNKLLGSDNSNLNAVKNKNLALLIDRLFVAKLQTECKGGEFTCKGSYVLLSSCLISNCKNKTTIDIMASNKVYIDADVHEEGAFMTIMSPRWEVIGNRLINLTGKVGPPTPPPDPAKKPGGPGVAGKPGKPGFPGGQFLAIGDEFEMKGQLAIKVNGGEGGPGQNGGEGGPSEDPPQPESPRIAKTMNFWNFDKNKTTPIKGGYNVTWGPKDNDRSPIVTDDEYADYIGTHFLVSKRGVKPGLGGNAGAGGSGGLSGEAYLIFLSKKPTQISVEKKQGVEGKPGKFGHDGKLCEIVWDIRYMRTNTYEWDKRNHKKTLVPNPNQGSGQPITKGRIAATEKPTPEPYQLSVNKFKAFLRNELPLNIKKNLIRSMLTNLQENPEVNSFYDILGFTKEYYTLEKQSFEKEKQIYVANDIDSLLKRIKGYSIAKKGMTNSERKVLAYLYTAGLGKLASLRNKDPVVVVDITKYLENDVLKLMKEKKKLDKAEVIRAYKNEYKNNVKDMMTEAQNLIDNDIMPSIDKNKKDMNERIYALVSNVKDLKEANKKEKKSLLEQEKELKKTLVWKKMLNFFTIAATTIKLFGPQAAAVVSVVEAGVGVASNLLIGGSSGSSAALAALPKAVQDASDGMTKLLNKEKEVLEKKFTDIKSEMSKIQDPETNKEFKKIIAKVSASEQALRAFKPKAGTGELKIEMTRLKREVDETIESEKANIEDKPSKNKERALKAIGYAQNIASIAETSVEEYKKMKADDKALEEIGTKIRQNAENFKKLEAYEGKIYSDIFPAISLIADQVSGLGKSAQGKSHAALDIAEWKVTEFLSDMRRQLLLLTKSFSMSEDLEALLNKVDRGMATMIKVYHRIQDNKEKAQLAVFLGDLNSDSTEKIDVGESLKSEFERLKKTVIINRILELYNQGKSSYLQTFFPFGVKEFQTHGLSIAYRDSNSSEALLAAATQKVNAMITSLKQDAYLLKDSSTTVKRRVPFTIDDDGNAAAFYIWKYKNHKEAIHKLLNGNPVTLLADINTTPSYNLDRNAIKFHTLLLVLISNDTSLQPEINKALKSFTLKLQNLGNFAYRCNKKIYEISNRGFTMSYYPQYEGNKYSFSGEEDNMRLINKAAHPMFSPYGQWRVSLSKGNVNALKKFQNKEIDLKFIGEGYFLEKPTNLCNEDLDRVYNRAWELESGTISPNTLPQYWSKV